jgi:hypothetical protein
MINLMWVQVEYIRRYMFLQNNWIHNLINKPVFVDSQFSRIVLYSLAWNFATHDSNISWYGYECGYTTLMVKDFRVSYKECYFHSLIYDRLRNMYLCNHIRWIRSNHWRSVPRRCWLVRYITSCLMMALPCCEYIDSTRYQFPLIHLG